MNISFDIKGLGSPIFHSPLENIRFVENGERVIYDVNYTRVKDSIATGDLITLERAGPRERIFFAPEETVAAIVTCGGLCPGLNNVIHSLVMQLFYQYRVTDIIGIRYGYRGLHVEERLNPIRLTPQFVENIHNFGGSVLGSSRGYSDAAKIVDGLEYYGIRILFAIGGDGTVRGALNIIAEIERRGLNIAVINIPKTIDNDIPFISQSFGFETSFSEAVESIRCAHIEARGTPYGIGIVKLMGRESGFIASQASLAQKDVNYVLVPEIDFELDGPSGLLHSLETRLRKREHALIVVAEGAGQKYFADLPAAYDASGNRKLHDVGMFLKKKIGEYFETIGMKVNVRYIDPSYIIRSVPANPGDAVFCGFLAENAVHAAMAGKTSMIIGKWNSTFVHLPMDIITLGRKKIDPREALWRSVKLSTGQPF
ncbi:MAG TPA: ATP-dependent 6-phosphofructokinase [Syntrophales bacterium]|nr:ATP-dependent 6-phosphofructokinase [Syntrophales bacterium]HPX10658.1 ATP-dependent 6-phosphofructokinase [Syntrophales bacterium]HQB30494.1 ATP-dependent 6-phosphofructokinase [Syntrophales bacterium]HQN78336.1 ATP-dependent 6-phosphofructokinase [Syntrophales bacterium]HQQ27159.1 ATP-dependent 6-phosphofructokinase [Syntrophales bacterium]